jgi:hypothetical protein
VGRRFGGSSLKPLFFLKNTIEVFAKIDFDDDPKPTRIITGCIRYGFPKGSALWSPKASKPTVFAKASIVFFKGRFGPGGSRG